ncbi:MAG: bis(5'-nucleosyl)-tetraphosphatase (symmetrical) YqeK, partial [Mycoplasmatales bacterium]
MNANLEQVLQTYLQQNLSTKRYNHVLSVVATAIKLGEIYQEDLQKLKIAALGHDITKEMKDLEAATLINKYFANEEVKNIKPAWHSYTGTIILREQFKITDRQILNAVKYHTLGHKDMDNIAKIIYIADFIEPTRTTPNLAYYQNLVFK